MHGMLCEFNKTMRDCNYSCTVRVSNLIVGNELFYEQLFFIVGGLLNAMR